MSEPDNDGWKYTQVTPTVQLRWRWVEDDNQTTTIEIDVDGLAAHINSAIDNSWQAKLVRDLPRCPHGRIDGDTCGGWTGPGPFDGGCYGGVSAGNPKLPVGQVFAYGLSAQNNWVMPTRNDRSSAEAWRAG